MTVKELQSFLDKIEDKDTGIIVNLDNADPDGYAELDSAEFTITSDGNTEVLLNPAL